MTIRRAWQRLLALARQRRLDGELDDEILAHLEMAERDGLARGLSPEEARRAARVAFGGVDQVKEEHRDRRSDRIVATFLRDVRYALWSLRRNPGFAIAAIGVLALGMSANTAMFSVVDAVLLKPLPYPEPERMVTVGESDVYMGASTLNFVDWRRLSHSFAALSAEGPATAAVMIGSEPERWRGYVATADYFKV